MDNMFLLVPLLVVEQTVIFINRVCCLNEVSDGFGLQGVLDKSSQRVSCATHCRVLVLLVVIWYSIGVK